jgi:hypothetical protein
MRESHACSVRKVCVVVLSTTTSAAGAAETCNSTMLPNGDFEENEWEDYKLKSWIKVKEFGSQVRQLFTSSSVADV